MSKLLRGLDSLSSQELKLFLVYDRGRRTSLKGHKQARILILRIIEAELPGCIPKLELRNEEKEGLVVY